MGISASQGKLTLVSLLKSVFFLKHALSAFKNVFCMLPHWAVSAYIFGAYSQQEIEYFLYFVRVKSFECHISPIQTVFHWINNIDWLKWNNTVCGRWITLQSICLVHFCHQIFLRGGGWRRRCGEGGGEDEYQT